MADRDYYIERLDHIFSRIGRRMRQRMSQETLTLGQYSLLKLLFDSEPMTVGEIAEELELSLASASAMIDRLVNQKLVIRSRSELDRRVVTVRLSPTGRAQVENLHQHRREFLRQLFLRISEEDLKTLLALIERLEDS
ncbi:MarR family winged helix-turn-helix transcriptional regulator [Sulfobacillus thermosulfidooxidans]|uniref:MarR family winged helix-turn-helix transcriptional regulator n=1 Tax=Sulfobacillus thermosulfidooxidans TaxID=28034 RepID=UPI00041DC524|nr:MarR family transcriptional regulator [Sulfobacillus thermosulfidooxidans]